MLNCLHFGGRPSRRENAGIKGELVNFSGRVQLARGEGKDRANDWNPG